MIFAERMISKSIFNPVFHQGVAVFTSKTRWKFNCNL